MLSPRSLRGDEDQAEQWVHGLGGDLHERQIDEEVHWFFMRNGGTRDAFREDYLGREFPLLESIDPYSLEDYDRIPDECDRGESDFDRNRDENGPSEKIQSHGMGDLWLLLHQPMDPPPDPYELDVLGQNDLVRTPLSKDHDDNEDATASKGEHKTDKRKNGGPAFNRLPELELHVGIRVMHVEAPSALEVDDVFHQHIFVCLAKSESPPIAEGDLQVTVRLINQRTLALVSRSIPKHSAFPPLRYVLIEVETTERALEIEVYPELA